MLKPKNKILKKFRRINKNAGFLMVEVLVAASIIVLVVLAAMSVAEQSITVARESTHMSQAAFLLEEGAESVRIFRDDNTWTNFTTIFKTTSTYYLPGTVSSWTTALPTTASGNTVGIFTRTITFASVNRDATTKNIVASGGAADAGTRLVTVTVSWTEGGATLSKSLQFYIMDIFS